MPNAAPSKLLVSSQKIREALQSENTFATVLLGLAAHVYGDDFIKWSPDTLLMEFQDDFNAELPQVNVDKLNAAIALLTTDRFYNSTPDFIDLCNALAGTPLNLNMFDPADSYEMTWGILEAKIIWSEPIPFSQEILGYIETTLEEEGLIRSPKLLEPIVPSYKLDVDQTLFDEDAAMFAAAYQTQQAKTADIDQAVFAALQALVSQLEDLHLLDGDVATKVYSLLK